jgi:hypothetical protein
MLAPRLPKLTPGRATMAVLARLARLPIARICNLRLSPGTRRGFFWIRQISSWRVLVTGLTA